MGHATQAGQTLRRPARGKAPADPRDGYAEGMSPSTDRTHHGSAGRSEAEVDRPVSKASPDEVEVSPAELATVLRNVAGRLDALFDLSDPSPGSTAEDDGSWAQGPMVSDAVREGAESVPDGKEDDGAESIDTTVLRLSGSRAAADAGVVTELGADADAACQEAETAPEEAPEAVAEEAPEAVPASASDVDARLDSVRRRMKERRAVVAVDDEPARRWKPWRARTDPQAASRVARRLLLVAAIVAVSAAAGLAVF